MKINRRQTEPEPSRPAGMAEPNFNNPNVHVQSWYVVDRATALRPGQVHSFDLLGRRIAVCRNSSGALYAVDPSSSVDLIFVDPPYNIGKIFAYFHDKLLSDDFYTESSYQ